eukprot:4353445-Karenia_brevis.AAC.1
MCSTADDLVHAKRRLLGATVKEVRNMKSTFALPIKYDKGKPKFVRSHRPSRKFPGWTNS